MECAKDNIFFCPRDQLAETSPVRRRQSQTTRNAFTISARETNSQKLVTRSLVMRKIIITKCAQDKNYFCSRDQLAERAPVRR
jgi:hypothetical protein